MYQKSKIYRKGELCSETVMELNNQHFPSNNANVLSSQSDVNTKHPGKLLDPFLYEKKANIATHVQNYISLFLLDPLQGSSLQVEILFVCLSICPSSLQFFSYSDSKLTQPPPVDLSHATSPNVSNAPHPCLP